MLLITLLVSAGLALSPLVSASSQLYSTPALALHSASDSVSAAGGDVYSSAAASPTSSAALVNPSTPTAPAPSPANLDPIIFTLALTLERLESAFYTQALAKFDVSALVEVGHSELQATVILEQVSIIAFDESAHVEVIIEILKAAGVTPFDGCSFTFDTILSDPVTFISAARTLEAVGVGAYLGAARLITDPALLTAAASIVTLEARHQTLLNILNGGTSAPQPFDLALAPEQVLSLAGGFLVNCSASDLGLTANPPLTITSDKGDSSFSVGTRLAFASSFELAVESLTCQMLVGGAAVARIAPASACFIPEEVDGPILIFLTNTTTPLQSNLINQDARGIQAGPGLIFVDSHSTALGSLFIMPQAHTAADVSYAAGDREETVVAAEIEQVPVAVAVVDAPGVPIGKDHDESRIIKVKRHSAGPSAAVHG